MTNIEQSADSIEPNNERITTTGNGDCIRDTANITLLLFKCIKNQI